MRVIDLMNVLRDANPDAIAMLLSDGDAEEYAQGARYVCGGMETWTYERGVSKGRPYYSLYPGSPHRDLRYDCEQVSYEAVSVVLLATKEFR